MEEEKRFVKETYNLTLAVLVPMVAKDYSLIRHNRLYGHGDPGGVDKVLPMNVFAGDVAAPGTAAQGKGKGHAIVVISTVGISLGLAHHHTANLGLIRQLHDMFLIGGMDTA